METAPPANNGLKPSPPPHDPGAPMFGLGLAEMIILAGIGLLFLVVGTLVFVLGRK
jgi:hypothetical protein